jgi:hypothetical protein
MSQLFNSSSGEQLSASAVVSELIAYMRERPLSPYRITIGTDSQLLHNGVADFVSAIVIHRVGNGGRYFFRRFHGKNFFTLRDRIIHEVLTSLELGTQILELLREHPRLQFEFEIHADVGEHGPTKAMLQEVIGMIRAYNFEAKVKPESYAASSIADRHV